MTLIVMLAMIAVLVIGLLTDDCDAPDKVMTCVLAFLPALVFDALLLGLLHHVFHCF